MQQISGEINIKILNYIRNIFINFARQKKVFLVLKGIKFQDLILI